MKLMGLPSGTATGSSATGRLRLGRVAPVTLNLRVSERPVE